MTSDTVSCLDMVKIALAVCGKLNNHEEEIFKRAVEKDLMVDLSALLSDSFVKLWNSTKQIFL